VNELKMTEQESPTTSPRLNWTTGLWLVGVAALLVGMYGSIGRYFAGRWVYREEYYHCLLVPVVIGWLLSRRWAELQSLPRRAYARGLWLLGAGLLLYLVAVQVDLRVAIGASFPVVLLGLVLAATGPQVFRRVGPIVALSFFLVPIPIHALAHIGMPLQRICTLIGGATGNVLGLHVLHQGVTLTMDGTSFIVAHACSGLNSLLALLFTCGVVIVFTEMRVLRAALVLALLLPVVILANSTRLVLVLLLAKFGGAEFALGAFMHGASDAIIYIFTLAGILLVVSLLSPRSLLPGDDGEDVDGGPSATSGATECEFAAGGGS
jgi:exosortase